MHPEQTKTRAWEALRAEAARLQPVHLRELFAEDPRRFSRYSVEACGLLFDYSKQRISGTALEALLALARAAEVPGWTARMFAGEPINNTEGRAVLHTALRNRSDNPVRVGGRDVMPDVREVLEHMRVFSEAVRSGEWRGQTGRRIESIVNIGIGGSDLGPAMVTTALKAYHHPGLKAHFVSNLDFTHIGETLAGLDPETTLFIVESKTFTTQETLTNAHTARRWFLERMGLDESAIARHFVAVSTNEQEVRDFGIDPRNMFGFWDWVGGRYSLWSAIGLPIVLMVGMRRFEALLAGAYAMDRHFREAPLEGNLPVLMGLLGVWNDNFLDAPTQAILPYDYALRHFPAYLQQLEMESNGKRVTREGQVLEHDTCPVVWGAPGNNGQHAFYQLMHQGTRRIPADFIVPIETRGHVAGHESKVLANALAQTEALMRGRTAEEARAELSAAGLEGEALEQAVPHRVLPGNQPTTTILYRRLTPEVMGTLIALYEHKVFVQSICWGINAFDQWGVELGKQLARRILPELTGEVEPGGHDASTDGLIDYILAHRDADPGHH